MAARGVPVRLATAVAASGQQASSRRKVYLDIDGRTVATKLVESIPADGRVPIVFRHVFTKPGWKRVAVRLEDDHLAADNQALLALEVAGALPVVVVDGDRKREPWASEADFLVPALAPPGQAGPWVDVQRIEPAALDADALRDRRVAILANVQRLTRDQLGAGEAFVARGGGLLLALGDRTDASFFNGELHRSGAGLVGCRLRRAHVNERRGDDALSILTDDLFHPALDRFRTVADDELGQARVFGWWEVLPAADEPSRRVSSNRSQVIAWLSGRRPWLLENTFGKGRVMVSAVPLDADWSDLPGKPAFVPLVHELVYYLAGTSAPAHNLTPGAPIVARFPAGTLTEAPMVIDPNGRPTRTVLERFPDHQLATHADTLTPGVYKLARATGVEPYVVRFDRRESDLTRLRDKDMGQLREWAGLRFMDDREQLYEEMFAPDKQQEIWQLIVVLVLLLLALEVWLTRRMAGAGQPEPKTLD